MDKLFHFEWAVDDHGYEPVSAEQLPAGVERPVLEEPPIGGGWWIRRRGGPLKRYRPLESRRGLARRFAYLPKDPVALLDFANEFGFLGVGQTGYEDGVVEEYARYWHQHMDFMRGIIETIKSGDKSSATQIFNQHVEPHMTIWIETPAASRPVLHVAPMNLLASMWFEIAGELTKGTQYKKCEWCPNWFPYGSGTGYKRNKRFCSNSCQKAAKRHQENKG